MGGYSLTVEEKMRLRDYLDRYREWVSPRYVDEPPVAVVLAKLLAAFPSQSQSESPAAQRIDAYFEALNGLPLWAIDEARKAVIGGRISDLDPRWAPTPPQFARIVEMIMAPHRSALAELARIAVATGLEEAVHEAMKMPATVAGEGGFTQIADWLTPDAKAQAA